MVNNEVLKNLGRAFGGYINHNLEYIADEKANEYFILADCETERDVQCKVLEWFGRAAHKSEPFSSDKKNRALHEKFLNGINMFLGTTFSASDMALIYQKLGNGCNHPLCDTFIEHGYDLEVLRMYRK